MADFNLDDDLLAEFDDFDKSETAPTTSGPNGQSIFNMPTDEADALLSPEADTRTQEEKDADAEKERQAQEALADLDNEVSNTTDEEENEVTGGTTKGRPRVEKSGLVEVGKKLIELKLLEDFEEEEDEKGNKKPNKPMEEYSVADWTELIKSNIEARVNAVKEQTPKEFYESLPQEMQFAAKYINDGGTDLKGLFKVLGEVEEVRQLDPEKPVDQEAIVRKYLQETDFGDSTEIEEQIADYKQAGTLAKWAVKHKPKLDSIQQTQVEERLAAQEQHKLLMKERRDMFHKNTYDALVKAELSGVKIDGKIQKKLYDNITQLSYKSLAGRPTTKLSADFERLQFGETPNMALIAEVSWLMDDPEGYKKHIAQTAVKDVVTDTARKIKQAQQNKQSGSGNDEQENNQRDAPRKGVARPQRNIFGR